jgi:hypothetical protein
MNRKDVAILFQEMFDECPSLEGKPFVLMPPTADDVLSKDYQIHIKAQIDESLLLCLRKIVKRHDKYAINEQKNLVVIYEPLKQFK